MFRPRLKAVIIKSACVRTFSQQMITAGRWVYLEKAMAAQREARKKEKEKGQEKEKEETKEETKATDRWEHTAGVNHQVSVERGLFDSWQLSEHLFY